MSDNMRWSFRTGVELQSELSYACESASTIWRAINRLEKEGLLRVDRTGAMNRLSFDRTLCFHIPKEIAKLCRPGKKNKVIRFKVEDARSWGICAAVLLENLRFQFRNEISDSIHLDGKPYYRLSASYLSKYFGCFDKSTIERALSSLLKTGRILRHPKRKGYYSEKVNRNGAFPLPHNAISGASECNDNNRCEIIDEKLETSLSSPAAPREEAPSIETELKDEEWYQSFPRHPSDNVLSELMASVTRSVVEHTTQAMDRINRFRQDPSYLAVDEDKEVLHSGLSIEELPFDDVSGWDKSIILRRGQAESVVEMCVGSEVVITKAQRALLKRLYLDNPQLRADHLITLFTGCLDVPNWKTLDIGAMEPAWDWEELDSREPKGDLEWYSRHARTLGYFLEHLPEIFVEFGLSNEEPFRSFDYSYLDKSPKRPRLYGEIFRENQVVSLKYF